MSFDLMWNFFIGKVYPALLVMFFFGLTIFIHELGHFWMARRRGMKVERFSIGFGPKIFSWIRDGIEYRVSWFPFGGYVALPQMSPMEALEGKSDSKPDELPLARPSSKILVAVAGPILNLVLALGMAATIWWAGQAVPVNPSVVGWVEPGSREETLGIRPGDRIVAVDGKDVRTWLEVHRAVLISLGADVEVMIERDGQRQQYLLETLLVPGFGVKTINLYPQGRPVARKVLNHSPAAAAGVEPGDKFLAVENVPISTAKELIEMIGKNANHPTALKVMRNGKVITLIAIPEIDPRAHAARIGVELGDEMEYAVVRPGPTPARQFEEVFAMMGDTVYALVHHRETGVGLQSISGPVGIAGSWWQQISQGGVRRGLWFAILLNINLAIINLLPIPVLDGGHVIFSLVEAARRRPINPRIQHVMSTVFAVALITFMLYVTFFDIRRIFPEHAVLLPRPETNQPGDKVAPAPAP